jgi:hypothetical protein
VPGIVYFNPHYHNPEIDEADFVIERNVGWNTVMSLSYMGSFGHMLPQLTDDNLTSTTSVTYNVAAGGPLKMNTYTVPVYNVRPNSSYAQMLDYFGVNSNWNSLVIQANHRMSHSVQFNANYTWSHGLDYDPEDATSYGPTTGPNLFYPNNLSLAYGTSNYNISNRFVMTLVADSPWRVRGPLRYLANGWQLAPIFTAQDGFPYNVGTSSSGPSAGIGGGIAGAEGIYGIPILGRNSFRMPGQQDLDLRLSKTFNIKEKCKLELMAEAFNLFNHYNVTGVTTEDYFYTTSGSVSTPSAGTVACSSSSPCLQLYTNSAGVPQFGIPTNANSTYAIWTRQLQFGARLSF